MREQRLQLKVRVTPEVYERIRVAAEEDERSVTGEVAYAIRCFLDKRDLR